MNDTHTAVFFCVFVADAAAFVRRAVVNYEQFKIFIALIEDGIQTFAKIFFRVVYAHRGGKKYSHIYPTSDVRAAAFRAALLLAVLVAQGAVYGYSADDILDGYVKLAVF